MFNTYRVECNSIKDGENLIKSVRSLGIEFTHSRRHNNTLTAKCFTFYFNNEEDLILAKLIVFNKLKTT